MVIQIYVSIAITAGLSVICIKTIALKHEYFNNEKPHMTQIGCEETGKGESSRSPLPPSIPSFNTTNELWQVCEIFSSMASVRVKQTDSILSVGQLQQFKDNAELIFYFFCNRLPQIGWKLEAESTKVEQRRSLFARVEI